MGRGLVALNLDDDLVDEGSQQLLPVARGGRGCIPDTGEIGPECEQAVTLLVRDRARALPLAIGKLGLGGFERPQALLPFAFEAACHQAVVRIDGAIAALALRFVAGPLD